MKNEPRPLYVFKFTTQLKNPERCLPKRPLYVYANQSIRVGRDPESDIPLNHTTVSWKHARIELDCDENGAHTLRITNTCDANSQAATRHGQDALNPGASIEIPPEQLKLQVGAFGLMLEPYEQTAQNPHFLFPTAHDADAPGARTVPVLEVIYKERSSYWVKILGKEATKLNDAERRALFDLAEARIKAGWDRPKPVYGGGTHTSKISTARMGAASVEILASQDRDTVLSWIISKHHQGTSHSEPPDFASKTNKSGELLSAPELFREGLIANIRGEGYVLGLRPDLVRVTIIPYSPS